MYRYDNRIVATLGAGGTNSVFSPMRGCDFIIDPITIPSWYDNLDKECLANIVEGFS